MRRLYDFHGGVHPAQCKTQSTTTPIHFAGIPPLLILPLSQHKGSPATLRVSVGEHVKKGQLLAEASSKISASVHAPTSGEIITIEERPVAHPSGLPERCVVLRPDGKDQWGERNPRSDYITQDPATLVAQIRRAGIAGMGGAGFPSDIKLSPRQPTTTLIINGAECEPYITADDMLMRERSSELAKGIAILQHILQPQETLLGIEDNKPEALAIMQAALSNNPADVVSVPTKYPSGGKNQLVEILTGHQIPSGTRSADSGIACINVGTCVAIYHAICLDQPLISRITTVTGNTLQQPQNMDVLLGTPVQYLLEQAGHKAEQRQRLIMGGPMMGFTLASADVPVVKITNCIIAPSAKEIPEPSPAQACIRCGLCADACPATLLPQQMYWFARGREFDKLEQHQLFDCIECGACSWVCPSHIPLVQYYRAAKADIIQLREESEKAEHAKARFEARQVRLERLAAEKDAKRAARKRAAEVRAKTAQTTGDNTDPIAAAIARAKAKKAAQQQATSGTVGEAEKLESAVLSIRKRLTTAEQKLAQAQTDGSDLVAALTTGVEKTREKLAKAEQALAGYQRQNTVKNTTDDMPDPVKDAIARAKARRAAAANRTPAEKARAEINKLEQRLEKTRQKVAQSEADNEQEKVLIALRATVERLDNKIHQARSALAETESESVSK